MNSISSTKTVVTQNNINTCCDSGNVNVPFVYLTT